MEPDQERPRRRAAVPSSTPSARPRHRAGRGQRARRCASRSARQRRSRSGADSRSSRRVARSRTGSSRRSASGVHACQYTTGRGGVRFAASRAHAGTLAKRADRRIGARLCPRATGGLVSPSRLRKRIARALMVSWREQPTRYDIEAVQANTRRVGLVIRVRWALLDRAGHLLAAGGRGLHHGRCRSPNSRPACSFPRSRSASSRSTTPSTSSTTGGSATSPSGTTCSSRSTRSSSRCSSTTPAA